MKFTDRAIAKLPPPPAGRKDYLLFDDKTQGLAVRVGVSSKRFIFQVRPEGGAQYRQTLGKFPALNVDEARKAVKVLAGRIAKGDDLRTEKAARKAKRGQARADAGYSFRDLILDWEEAHKPKCRPNYVKGTGGGLRRVYKPLLERPAAAVTLEQLEEVWESLADLPAAANAAAERARTVFTWGVKTKRLPVNPTQGVDLPEKSGKRTHAPTGAEAQKIWAAASTMSARDRAAISLLQVSLLRRTEAFGALWSEFSDDYSKFSPSPQRMKMGKPFVVWLPPVMQKMLAELPKFEGSDLLFSRDGRKPLTGYTALKKRLDKALEGSGVRPFRLHDLRRSGVTWLAEAGVSSIVADRLLGHASLKSISPTADIYNVYEFASERQGALRLWADFLTGEEEASSSPSPQLVLPPPASPAPAEADPAAALQLIGVEEWEAKAEENFSSLLLRIASRSAVIRANFKILKRDVFAPKFLETLGRPSDPHEVAISVLTHTAALAHQGGITVFKRSEVATETARRVKEEHRWRDKAKKASAEEEQALGMGYEEYAAAASAEGQKAAAIADLWDRALQTMMTADDVCVVAYRKGGPASREARARGVFRMLLLLTETIFGKAEPGIAAAYTTAVTGIETLRWQARYVISDGKVEALKSVAR
jgi:integrase